MITLAALGRMHRGRDQPRAEFRRTMTVVLAFEMKKKRMELRDTEKIRGLHDLEMDYEGGGKVVKN